MRRVRIGGSILAGIVAAWGTAGAAQQAVAPGCAKIVAVLEQGGGLSPDEVAKRTSTDVETVRNCTDQWRATQKDPGAPKGATAGAEPMPPGCAKIVAVLEEGGGLSADEVAKRTSTDAETVRNCTDLWRRRAPK